MKATIAQQIIDEMDGKGYRLIGQTSGQISYRKGSNLYRKLTALNVTEADVIVRAGARAGKHLTEGYQLLIFTKKEE
jgi:hypothetical protein